MTGSYDPATNTAYVGVGNPSPWLAVARKGRNLYTDSIIAIDPDNGKLKFYFQETPNDSWDYDATSTPPLVDLTIDGKPRKVFLHAARNGWFYVVDRTNGDLVLARPFTMATSVTGYDKIHRIGLTNDALKPRVGTTVFTCPAFFGGDNWWGYSYDPQTHYAYVPTMHTCMKLGGEQPKPHKTGIDYAEETFEVEPMPGAYGWGALTAIDVATGKRAWSFETKYPWNDGSMSTDGGLVFSGTPDQKFYAFDARTGKVLWMHHMASGVIGQPVSYMVDGKQYVAVQSGYGGVAPIYGGKKMTPIFRNIHLGGTLYVFSL
jgi:alcohol dehydrogenase (cytochrome c)